MINAVFILSQGISFMLQTHELITVFFCGVISLLLLIVAIVFFRNREQLYLHYAGFLFFTLMYALSTLMPDSLRFAEASTLLSFSCYVSFAIALVDIPSQYPRIAKQLKILATIGFIYAIAYFIFFTYIKSYHLYIFVGSRVLIFSVCSYFLILLHRHIQSPVKRLFIIGSFAYLLGSAVASLRYILYMSGISIGYLPPLTSTNYFQLGILFQALFFTLALGQRVVFLYKKQDKVMQTQIAALSEKEHVTQTLNKALEKEIEARVQEMTTIREALQQEEKERMRSDYERKLLASEIRAKQAQINPHFIFNSLNSIKYLILQEDSSNAVKYLVLFSRFIRNVMDMMGEPTVPLDQEASMIRAYLELEQKRFSDDFTFIIDSDTPEVLSDFQIPPLLLQPFVENAIWHGLLTSDRDSKNLTIAIRRAEQKVTIVIADNGSGRGKATAPHTQNTRSGLGIRLTKERIKLFNHNHEDMKIALHIQDLKDESGTALGTRVTLTLQLRQRKI